MRIEPPPTLTLDAALRDLASASAQTRATAADALGTAPPESSGAAADALVAALGDRDADVRSAAALSLGELGLERAVPPLLACLDDREARVRQAAIVALGRLGLPSAFEPLAAALTDGSPDVRFQAATSLVEIDAARAFDPLLAALDDPDGEVVGAAALGLGAIGDRRAADPLVARLDHARRETRFEVAYALARLGDPRATPHVAGFVRDPALGWDAVEALELAGDPAGESALAAAMTDDRLAREVMLRAAAALLTIAPGSGHAERARAVLVRGLSALRHRHRALAVELLGQVGGGWARAPLEALGRRFGGRKLGDEIADALRRIDARAAEATDTP